MTTTWRPRPQPNAVLGTVEIRVNLRTVDIVPIWVGAATANPWTAGSYGPPAPDQYVRATAPEAGAADWLIRRPDGETISGRWGHVDQGDVLQVTLGPEDGLLWVLPAEVVD